MTGAGRGLGEAIALRFAREGAAVMVSDIDAATAARTVEQIRRAGGRAAAVVGSVTDETVVLEIVQRTVEEFGSPGILVNNAGVTRDKLGRFAFWADPRPRFTCTARRSGSRPGRW